MARSVADAAAILSVIAGPDERDAATAAIPGPVPDYRTACRPDALRGARIGVPRNYIAVKLAAEPDKALKKDEHVVFEAALGAMRELGAEIVDADFPDLPAFTKLGDYSHNPILPADLNVGMSAQETMQLTRQTCPPTWIASSSIRTTSAPSPTSSASRGPTSASATLTATRLGSTSATMRWRAIRTPIARLCRRVATPDRMRPCAAH